MSHYTINPAGTVLLSGTIESRPVPKAETAFDRFEDLTRKLVDVPKRELDEAQNGDNERA